MQGVSPGAATPASNLPLSVEKDPVVLRRAVSHDAHAAHAFVMRLSPESRYHRFHGAVRELPTELLDALLRDDAAHAAWVAVAGGPGGAEMVGLAGLELDGTGDTAEFGVAVLDAWQRRGLGRGLLQDLVRSARQLGAARLTGEVLGHNTGMILFCKAQGFSFHRSPRDARVVVAELQLGVAT
jgi:GNAT superfamily N-acetyltransferase